MNNLTLENPSRRRTVKILALGNYIALALDIIQSLAFVPLYLLYFGDKLYGFWLATGGIIAVLAFLDMGMATLTIQRISSEYGKKNLEGVGLYFFNGLLIHICFMILLLIGGIFLSFSLNTFFNLSNEDYVLLAKASQLAIVALVITLLNNTIEGTLNALQKPLFGKLSQIFGNILGIIGTYLFLINNYSVLAIPLGLLLRALFSTLINFFYVLLIFRKNGISLLRFNSNVIKDYLNLSPSILLSKIGSSMVGNIEPFLITTFISPQISVYYSITSKAGVLFKTILDRLGGILLPALSHLYANEGPGKLKSFILTFTKVLLPAMISGFAIYFLLNKSFVSIWVGKQNYLGDIFTFLIALSLLVSFLSNIISYMFTAVGDIRYPSNLVFFESIIKLIMLYLLLRLFGIYGLPLAVIVTSIVFILVYLRRWNSHLKVTKSEIHQFKDNLIRNIFFIAAVTVIIYFALSFFDIVNYKLFGLISIIVVLLSLLVLIYSNEMILNYIRTNYLRLTTAKKGSNK